MMLPQILEEYSKDEMYGRAWKRVEMRRREIYKDSSLLWIFVFV
jgi:hypothetical protein